MKAPATSDAQYRLLNTVIAEVIGVVVAGTVTAGTVIFALPSGYYNPINVQGFPMILGSGSSSAFCWAQARTNGNVTVEGVATSGDEYYFHAFLALDA